MPAGLSRYATARNAATTGHQRITHAVCLGSGKLRTRGPGIIASRPTRTAILRLRRVGSQCGGPSPRSSPKGGREKEKAPLPLGGGVPRPRRSGSLARREGGGASDAAPARLVKQSRRVSSVVGFHRNRAGGTLIPGPSPEGEGRKAPSPFGRGEERRSYPRSLNLHSTLAERRRSQPQNDTQPSYYLSDRSAQCVPDYDRARSCTSPCIANYLCRVFLRLQIQFCKRAIQTCRHRRHNLPSFCSHQNQISSALPPASSLYRTAGALQRSI